MADAAGGWSGDWPLPDVLARRIEDVHGTPVTPATAGLLLDHLKLLERWAPRFNLISARSREEVVERHLVDAFGVVAVLHDRDRVVDVGSGAGFPGVPVAVAGIATSVLLVEPRRHRANFLREVVRRLDLERATVLEARADTVEEGSVDVVTGRAIQMAELVAVAERVLSPGGRLAWMRKSGVEAALPRGWELDRTHRYRLSDGPRHEVVVLVRRCST